MRIALQALRRNVMRTMLTMLGVIIGVAAVIAMMEISRGASVAIEVTVTKMGANVLAVLPGAPQRGSGASARGTRSSRPTTPRPSSENAADVVCTAPIVDATAQVVYGNRSWIPTYLTGSTPAFLEARNWVDLDLGRAFNEREVRSGSKVCLIGKTAGARAVPIALPDRPGNSRPQRAVQGDRRLEPEGRRPAGHRPGRHPAWRRGRP